MYIVDKQGPVYNPQLQVNKLNSSLFYTWIYILHLLSYALIKVDVVTGKNGS